MRNGSESWRRTLCAVRCKGYGGIVEANPCRAGRLIYLPLSVYRHWRREPEMQWTCPRCGADAVFDEENFRAFTARAGERRSWLRKLASLLVLRPGREIRHPDSSEKVPEVRTR